MANSERRPTAVEFAEIGIGIDPSSLNPVVLTATNTKKENFDSLEEALKKKKKEVHSRNIALSFRAVGIAGVLGGLSFMVGGAVSGNLRAVVEGSIATYSGIVLILFTEEHLNKRNLARKQVSQIQSAMMSNMNKGTSVEGEILR